MSHSNKRQYTLFKKHRTRMGNTILLAEMSNEHLLNTIKLHILPIITKMDDNSNVELSELNYLLYDVPKPTTETLADDIIKALYITQPYLVEAYLRGLEEPRELLRQLLNRKELLESNKIILIDAEGQIL